MGFLGKSLLEESIRIYTQLKELIIPGFWRQHPCTCGSARNLNVRARQLQTPSPHEVI